MRAEATEAWSEDHAQPASPSVHQAWVASRLVLVRRAEAGEFEVQGIEPAGSQLPDAILDAVAEGLDALQGKCLQEYRFPVRCEFPNQRFVLIERQAIDRAADEFLRIQRCRGHTAIASNHALGKQAALPIFAEHLSRAPPTWRAPPGVPWSPILATCL